ncbi:MAG: methionyl-tRNA formyltransferase [Lachnospiraceae bacterium]
MKIVFMGTPDFAVGALQAIIDAGHEVTAVVTQPDRPKGRGKEMQYTPVKECALAHHITVFQPVKIKTEAAVATLQTYEADIFVVAAFGQILSTQILEMPRLGCVNIHASLLPKYRGAAPIQWAIIDGETKSGITIMQMDAGLDTGDILYQKEVPITKTETGETLHDKLMVAGAEAIVEVLPLLEQGSLIPCQQSEETSCYAKMLHKEMGHISWSLPAVKIERLVRGLNAWPSAYTHYHQKTLKIWEAEALDLKTNGPIGTIAEVTKDYFTVNTGLNQLKILDVQLEGKKRMKVHDFLLGNVIEPLDELERIG